MANTIDRGQLQASVSVSASGPTGALQNSSMGSTASLSDGSAYTFDKILELSLYDLTVASGDLDIDLYDLGTLDLGAGPGRDNLGNLWAQGSVQSLYIENVSSSAGVLRIDQNGLATTAWKGAFGGNAVIDLPAGAFILANVGDSPITDVTDHMLRLSAQTDDVTINVHITTSDM